MAEDPTGVCLLYMGGPATLNQVQPFLRELFSDRDLIRLPAGQLLQPPLARLIARLRAPRVTRYYAEIGGGSPLGAITARQAELLEAALSRCGRGRYRVAVAMRYTSPRAADAVEQLQKAGVRRLIALPLYPHYSAATSGSSFGDLDRALEARGAAGEFEVQRVCDFHDHPGYLDALATKVHEGLAALAACSSARSAARSGTAEHQAAGHQAAEHGAARSGTVAHDRPPLVLFSAHSLPLRLIEAGDPYQRQVETTAAAVAARLQLPPDRWRLAYQSRSGPVRWLGPDVRRTIEELAAAGERSLLAVPLSFVSDHIETLHEIDVRLRRFCLARGITAFARSPSLNDDPAFISALAEIVLARSEAGAQR